MVSELLYWCSYGKCYIREQKDARPRVDAVTATTSNSGTNRGLSRADYSVFKTEHRCLLVTGAAAQLGRCDNDCILSGLSLLPWTLFDLFIFQSLPLLFFLTASFLLQEALSRELRWRDNRRTQHEFPLVLLLRHHRRHEPHIRLFPGRSIMRNLTLPILRSLQHILLALNHLPVLAVVSVNVHLYVNNN
jgi:hypothetical protein